MGALIILSGVVLIGTAEAGLEKPKEIAGAIAFLMPLSGGACSGITFDPLPMVRKISPKNPTIDAIRRRYAHDFNMSLKEAQSRISTEGMPAFCELIHDFFGRARGEFPGLTIQ
jgi:hypothetical protein